MQIEFAGHSWITGQRAPKVEGWRCYWVTHHGTDRTVFHYRRSAA